MNKNIVNMIAKRITDRIISEDLENNIETVLKKKLD